MHISIRRNLRYIILMTVFYYIRKVDLIIINATYNFEDSLLFTLLMFIGEFLAGLSIYISQKCFLKSDIKNNKYFKILLTKFTPKMKRKDSIFIILLLIFFTASFDFVEFIIGSFYIPKLSVVSPTAEYRLGELIIILGALLCHYNLKIKILKHQFYSLLIMGVCLIILIILEIFYRGIGVSFIDFLIPHLLILCNLVFVAFTDVIEKYLMEYNYLNPFLILMLESIFGLIFIIIYSSNKNVFNLSIFYTLNNIGNFILLLFLLFLYVIFSAGTNVYKMLTIALYSPMTKTLAVYIFNPVIFIYYFIMNNDFISEGQRNYFYFLSNIIIALIISFVGCVFNEFIILSCCNLEYETHFFVSERAVTQDIFKSLEEIDDSDNESLNGE